MTWVRTKLLPNLPQQAILVKDNASYYNVKINKDPTSATKKNDMILMSTGGTCKNPEY
jgi:hypothetical protein